MPYNAKGIDNFGDYLERMKKVYGQIRHRELDLFVCRGDDNPVVILPNVERPVREDGSVELRDADYDYIRQELNGDAEMVVASIRDGLIPVYRLTQPEYDEHVDIGKLERTLAKLTKYKIQKGRRGGRVTTSASEELVG